MRLLLPLALMTAAALGCDSSGNNDDSSPGVRWRGEFSETTTYQPGDLVRVGADAVYIATAEVAGGSPEGSDRWALFVRGAQGPAGMPGAQGEPGSEGPQGPQGPEGPPGGVEPRGCAEGMIRLDANTCADGLKLEGDGVEDGIGALGACIARGQRLCSYEELLLALHCFEGPEGRNNGGAGCYDPATDLRVGRTFLPTGCEPILQPANYAATGNGVVQLGPSSPAGEETWELGFNSEVCGGWQGYRCCVDL